MKILQESENYFMNLANPALLVLTVHFIVDLDSHTSISYFSFSFSVGPFMGIEIVFYDRLAEIRGNEISCGQWT